MEANSSQNLLSFAGDCLDDVRTMSTQVLVFLICGFCVILGCPSNLIVMFTTATMKSSHRVHYILVFQQSLVDLSPLLTVVPAIFYNIIHPPRDRSYEGGLNCLLCGLTKAIVVTASMWTTFTIGFNRYICIVHPNISQRMFNKTSAVLIVVIIWVISTAEMMIPYILGVGRSQYNQRAFMCTYDWPGSPAVASSYLAVILILDILTAFFYVMIMVTVIRSNQRIHNVNSDKKNCSKVMGTEVCPKEKRLAKNLFMIFLVFNVIWIPYMVLAQLVDPVQCIPNPGHFLIHMLLLLKSVLNPAVQIFMDQNIRNAFKQRVNKSCAGKFLKCKLSERDKHNTKSQDEDKSYHVNNVTTTTTDT